jgi:hypothetical protein
MKTLRVGLLCAVLALGGCGIFGEDPTPEFVTMRLSGDAGSTVSVVLSTFFNTGVDELGVNRVTLGLADTLQVVLPWDTVVDVRVQRRLFTELSTPGVDTASTRLVVDVDGRSLFDDTRQVSADDPFRFLYLFNVRVTGTNIEVF